MITRPIQFSLAVDFTLTGLAFICVTLPHINALMSKLWSARLSACQISPNQRGQSKWAPACLQSDYASETAGGLVRQTAYVNRCSHVETHGRRQRCLQTLFKPFSVCTNKRGCPPSTKCQNCGKKDRQTDMKTLELHNLLDVHAGLEQHTL